MRVAIYCRVSTDEQKQGGTIESQINELETFARNRGDVVVERYIDDGWSGSLLSRPALDALRDAAGSDLFEAVVVNDVDRLSRDIANLAVLKRDLEQKRVDLIFRKLPTDKGPLSDFMVNILGSFAEFERAMISDRTRRGRRYKVQERKLIVGNRPPYGYDYVKRDRDRGIEGHYRINKKEARVVVQMFNWIARDGLSERAVARRLNELKIPARHSRSWAWSSVHRILANETYTGTTYYNKNEAVHRPGPTWRRYRTQKNGQRLRAKSEWIPIPLPPALHIINRETFELVRRQVDRNRAFSPRNVKHFYLLRLVRRRCAQCGAAFAGTPYHGRTFYRCLNHTAGSREPGRDKCPAKIVSANRIEPPIWEAVVQAIQNPALVVDQIERYQARLSSERGTINDELGQIERDLATLNTEEERVLAAYRTGVTTLAQFEREMSGINQRQATALEMRERLRSSISASAPRDSITRDVSSWCAALRTRLQTLTAEEQQRILGELINEIVISDDDVVVRAAIPAFQYLYDPSNMKGEPLVPERHNEGGATSQDGEGVLCSEPKKNVRTVHRALRSTPQNRMSTAHTFEISLSLPQRGLSRTDTATVAA